jgi:hypothetical protein
MQKPRHAFYHRKHSERIGNHLQGSGVSAATRTGLFSRSQIRHHHHHHHRLPPSIPPRSGSVPSVCSLYSSRDTSRQKLVQYRAQHPANPRRTLGCCSIHVSTSIRNSWHSSLAPLACSGNERPAAAVAELRASVVPRCPLIASSPMLSLSGSQALPVPQPLTDRSTYV